MVSPKPSLAPILADAARAIAQRRERMAGTVPALADAFKDVADAFVRIAADRGIPLDEVQVGGFLTKCGRIVISLSDPLMLIASIENLPDGAPLPDGLEAYIDDDET